jgi:hypothetical protein
MVSREDYAAPKRVTLDLGKLQAIGDSLTHAEMRLDALCSKRMPRKDADGEPGVTGYVRRGK